MTDNTVPVALRRTLPIPYYKMMKEFVGLEEAPNVLPKDSDRASWCVGIRARTYPGLLSPRDLTKSRLRRAGPADHKRWRFDLPSRPHAGANDECCGSVSSSRCQRKLWPPLVRFGFQSGGDKGIGRGF